MTDFGETIDDLFLSGVKLLPDDHRLEPIRARFGTSIDNGVITTIADAARLGDAISQVIHARLDLADLVYNRKVRAAPSFFAAIELWLDERHLVYERDVEVQGRATAQVSDSLVERRRRSLLIEAISTQRASYATERRR